VTTLLKHPQINQASKKRLELEKTHQQQFFLYHWLQGPDPELKSVTEEIEDLNEQRRRLYDILQVAAS
jgi:hypothetical protein